MLQSSDGSDSLRLNRPAPLKINEVKDEQIVEPVLAIASTEHKHHVLDHAGSVELAHGSLTANDTWNVEGEFLDALFQINEYYI